MSEHLRFRRGLQCTHIHISPLLPSIIPLQAFTSTSSPFRSLHRPRPWNGSGWSWWLSRALTNPSPSGHPQHLAMPKPCHPFLPPRSSSTKTILRPRIPVPKIFPSRVHRLRPYMGQPTLFSKKVLRQSLPRLSLTPSLLCRAPLKDLEQLQRPHEFPAKDGAFQSSVGSTPTSTRCPELRHRQSRKISCG